MFQHFVPFFQQAHPVIGHRSWAPELGPSNPIAPSQDLMMEYGTNLGALDIRILYPLAYLCAIFTTDQNGSEAHSPLLPRGGCCGALLGPLAARMPRLHGRAIPVRDLPWRRQQGRHQSGAKVSFWYTSHHGLTRGQLIRHLRAIY